MRMNYLLLKLTTLFISKIVQYYDVLKVIVSNRDPGFTSNFWKALQVAMGTQLTIALHFTLGHMDSHRALSKHWSIFLGHTCYIWWQLGRALAIGGVYVQ